MKRKYETENAVEMPNKRRPVTLRISRIGDSKFVTSKPESSTENAAPIVDQQSSLAPKTEPVEHKFSSGFVMPNLRVPKPESGDLGNVSSGVVPKPESGDLENVVSELTTPKERMIAASSQKPADDKKNCIIIGDDRVTLPINTDYIDGVYSSIRICNVITGKTLREVNEGVMDALNNAGPNIEITTVYMLFSAAFNYNKRNIDRFEWCRLLIHIHLLYPKAQIYTGGIIQPVFGGKLKYHIKKSNKALHDVTLKYATFINPKHLTKSRGKINRNLYVDPIHLNFCGVYKVLMKLITSSF